MQFSKKEQNVTEILFPETLEVFLYQKGDDFVCSPYIPLNDIEKIIPNTSWHQDVRYKQISSLRKDVALQLDIKFENEDSLVELCKESFPAYLAYVRSRFLYINKYHQELSEDMQIDIENKNYNYFQNVVHNFFTIFAIDQELEKTSFCIQAREMVTRTLGSEFVPITFVTYLSFYDEWFKKTIDDKIDKVSDNLLSQLGDLWNVQ